MMSSKERFEKLEIFLSAHRGKIAVGSYVLTFLFSLLLFNARISEGADDSSYIYAGSKYSKDLFNYFYTNNAPLYPLLLSIPIKLFGVKLILLKCTSLIFYFFSVFFFFRALEKRIPYLVLIPSLLFFATSSFLQYYASQTYNEAFFLFLQSLFIFYFFKLLDKLKVDSWNALRQNWRGWLTVGSLAALLSLTKNLGVMIYPIVILYFLTQRQWRQASISGGVLIGIRLSLDGLKYLIWGNLSQFAAQSATLFNIDPYTPEKGTEDILGIAERFIGNCKIFLSNRCQQIFGFMNEYYRGLSVTITFCVIILFIVALVFLLKEKNKYILFTWLYVGGLVFVSFIVLQHDWAQIRMIVIHIPLLLLMISYAVYKLVERVKFGHFIYFSIFIFLLGSPLITSIKKIGTNYPILIKNLKGDPYYGYTPDWKHFLQMSKWCADSLPENAVVVSRKAAMSFIYGKGKEFFPINRVLFYDPVTNQADPDSVLMYCQQNHLQYFMLASIRFYPQQKTTETVNTLEVFLTAFHNKYPDKIVYVRTEGEKDDEPCFLYEIKY